MAYVASNGRLGLVDLSTVTSTLGTPGISQLPSVTLEPQLGETCAGWDPNLGGAEFIYGKAASGLGVGNVCETIGTLAAGYLSLTMAAWLGTALQGRSLCVALNAMTPGQFGWFQIQGSALVAITGSPSSGNNVYWQSNGVVSSSVVASKQVLNAQFVSTGSPTVGQGSTAITYNANTAIIFIDRPCSQSAIT